MLYVTPATNDLNTGEALALAREVDPEGKRTLTIATKIDRREKHSFAKQFKDQNSGLGLVCVRNRTQEEVESGLSFDDLLRKEEIALSESDLQAVPNESKGISQLIEQLVTLQSTMLLGCKRVLRRKLEIERKTRDSEL